MKKYIYLFAIIILFLLAPLPSGEKVGVRGHNSPYSPLINLPPKVLIGEGIRGLLFPSPAEAYTYQDVENAYNNAKIQYPNAYIFIEEFSQNGQKGYKIWKRPRPGPVMRAESILYMPWAFSQDCAWLKILRCDGTSNKDIFLDDCDGNPITVYRFARYKIHWTYCDGTVDTTLGSNTDTGVRMSPDDECLVGITNYSVNCKANDVLLATFFPIDECEGKTEICDGKDNNCNKDNDEGASDCSLE